MRRFRFIQGWNYQLLNFNVIARVDLLSRTDNNRGRSAFLHVKYDQLTDDLSQILLTPSLGVTL